MKSSYVRADADQHRPAAVTTHETEAAPTGTNRIPRPEWAGYPAPLQRVAAEALIDQSPGVLAQRRELRAAFGRAIHLPSDGLERGTSPQDLAAPRSRADATVALSHKPAQRRALSPVNGSEMQPGDAKADPPQVAQLKPGKKTHIAVGAVIGSLIPVLGTAVGGFVGYQIYKKKKRQQNRGANHSLNAVVDSQTVPESNDYGTEHRRDNEESAEGGDRANDSSIEMPIASRQRNTKLALLAMQAAYKGEKIKYFDEHERRVVTYQLRGGLLRSVATDEPLHTRDRELTQPEDAMKTLMLVLGADGVGALYAEMEHQQLSMDRQESEMKAKATQVGGLFIFVMNEAGDIFSAKEIGNVVHHSSFLRGGSVAAAGYIQVDNGRITYINNHSGHYKPGPFYLFQAVKVMEGQGVDLDNLRIRVLGADKIPYANAAAFVQDVERLASEGVDLRDDAMLLSCLSSAGKKRNL